MAVSAVVAVASSVVGSTVAEAVGGAIVGSVFEAGIVGSVGAAISVSNVIGGVAGVVASMATSAVARSVLGSGGGASSSSSSQVSSAAATGLLVNSQSAIAPIPVVYGYRKMAGTLVAPLTVSGSHSEYLNYVICLCEGPIQAIDTVYLDGVPSTDVRFSGLLQINKHLGTPADPADSLLMANVTGWDSYHTLSGCAYLYVQVKFSSSAFTAEPNITCDIRGRTLYDPRDSGTRWSDNPALVARDYLTNAIYGKGLSPGVIDDTTFGAAATQCESRLSAPGSPFSTTVTIDPSTHYVTFAAGKPPFGWGDGVQFTTTGTLPSPLATGTTYYIIFMSDTTLAVATTWANAMAGTAISITTVGSGTLTVTHYDYARYSCNGVINIDDTAYNNYRAILTSCLGMPVFSGGKYKLILDQPQASTGFVFSEDNIVGSWTITQSGKQSRFNRVTGSVFNASKGYQADMAQADSATFRAVDNGLVLNRQIDLPFTQSIYQATAICWQVLNQSRFGVTAQFTAFPHALRCEVGDIVQITHGTPGWLNKLFRVMAISPLDAGDVQIAVGEYDASVYVAGALPSIVLPPSSNLPNPFTCPTPSGLAVTSVFEVTTTAANAFEQLAVTWTPATDPSVATTEIWVQTTADYSLLGAVSATSGQFLLNYIKYGLTYNVKIRNVNSFGICSAFTSPVSCITTANAGDVVHVNLFGVAERLPIGTVGSQLKIITKLPGIDWYNVPLRGPNSASVWHLGYVTCGGPGPQMVILGMPGGDTKMAAFYTADGITFTPITALSSYLSSISGATYSQQMVYANGIYLMAGISSSSPTTINIAYSSDAVTWYTTTKSCQAYALGLLMGGGSTFMMLYTNSSGVAKYSTSSNGSTWTDYTRTTVGSQQYCSWAYSSGVFYILMDAPGGFSLRSSYYSVTTTGTEGTVSTPSNTWTHIAISGSTTILSSSSSNAIYYKVGAGSWTAAVSFPNVSGLAVANGSFVAVGFNTYPTDQTMWTSASADGITWSALAPRNQPPIKVGIMKVQSLGNYVAVVRFSWINGVPGAITDDVGFTVGGSSIGWV